MNLVEKILDGDLEAVRVAEICLQDNLPLENAPELRRALIKHYNDRKGTRRDGGVNHLQRDSEAALRHIRVLHRELPNDHGLTHQLCSLLIETGWHAEAMRSLEDLSRVFREDQLGPRMTIMASIAYLRYVHGAFDQAAAIYEDILARTSEMREQVLPDNQEMFFGPILARLSRLHLNAGAYAEAVRVIETFPHAINFRPVDNTLKRARALLRDGLPSRRTDARAVNPDQLTVACVKHGSKYGPDYVNRLYSMVRRHLPGNWRFVCLTEDPRDLVPGIDVIDISNIMIHGARVHGWWTKLALFDPDTPFVDQTIFYLDLDTVIVGDLGFIEGLKVGFHVLEHSFNPGFNSSVMLFDRSFAAPVHQRFQDSDAERLVGDQDWLEECMPGIDVFPREPIRLYKSLEPDIDSNALARTGARIVTFPTVPKPHQIDSGWVKDHWR